jgi:hypothetical protein
MAKILIAIGIAIAGLGALLYWFPGLFSWFGKLPGDIRVERESGGFYFPVVSMLIVSVVLSIVLNLFLRR